MFLGQEKMNPMPVLKTERLLLRPFQKSDAMAVRILAGEEAIAATTLNIPHPYEEGMARAWINRHQEEYDLNKSLCLAVTDRITKRLVGAISLTNIDRRHNRAELGYWIGLPFWNKGYCTEAAAELIRYGFSEMKLNRIYATHFLENPASGRVMEKIGMLKEGLLRRHACKENRYIDLVMYGILKGGE